MKHTSAFNLDEYGDWRARNPCLVLCGFGLRHWFSIPDDCRKIWVTLSDAPLPDGYEGRIVDGFVELKTSAGDWVFQTMTDTKHWVIDKVGTKPWYVNVEYEA